MQEIKRNSSEERENWDKFLLWAKYSSCSSSMMGVLICFSPQFSKLILTHPLRLPDTGGCISENHTGFNSAKECIIEAKI